MEPTGDEEVVEAPAIGRSSLRNRMDPVDMPLDHLPLKTRALRAAKEHLETGKKLGDCADDWLVNRGLIYYYKRVLSDAGMSPSTPLSPLSAPSSISDCNRSDCSSKKSKSSVWDEYCAAYIYAGQQVVILGKRRAAKQASEKFGVRISATTAQRAAETPGQGPKAPGRNCILPSGVENKLEDLCLLLREMKLPIFRFMVLSYVNTLLAGTAEADMLKHREVRKHWYYNWLGRCTRLKTANIRPLEITRAQWATPSNILRHYEMLADMLVQLNIAVRNPDFDPTVPLSEPVKIVKPGRLGSMDESRLLNDSTEVGKKKDNRILMGQEGNSGKVLVNKGDGDGTGIGGSTAGGMDFPGQCCPCIRACVY